MTKPIASHGANGHALPLPLPARVCKLFKRRLTTCRLKQVYFSFQERLIKIAQQIIDYCLPMTHASS